MMNFISMFFGAVFIGFVILCIHIVCQVIASSRKVKSTDIVGHHPAKREVAVASKAAPSTKQRKKDVALNMATSNLGFAFAEQPDWSEYDQPTYLRKKQELKVFEEVKDVQAEVVSLKRQPSSRKKSMTPQEQLAEFKKNSKGRYSNGKYETL